MTERRVGMLAPMEPELAPLVRALGLTRDGDYARGRAGDVEVVALDEDPAVRIPTRMVDCEPDALTFEMPVRVVFRPLVFTDVEGTVPAPLFVPA